MIDQRLKERIDEEQTNQLNQPTSIEPGDDTQVECLLSPRGYTVGVGGYTRTAMGSNEGRCFDGDMGSGFAGGESVDHTGLRGENADKLSILLDIGKSVNRKLPATTDVTNTAIMKIENIANLGLYAEQTNSSRKNSTKHYSRHKINRRVSLTKNCKIKNRSSSVNDKLENQNNRSTSFHNKFENTNKIYNRLATNFDNKKTRSASLYEFKKDSIMRIGDTNSTKLYHGDHSEVKLVLTPKCLQAVHSKNRNCTRINRTTIKLDSFKRKKSVSSNEVNSIHK